MPLGKNQRFQALSLPTNHRKGKNLPSSRILILFRRMLRAADYGCQSSFLPLLDRGEGRGEESTSLRNPQSRAFASSLFTSTLPVLNFPLSRFGFVSDFEIHISDLLLPFAICYLPSAIGYWLSAWFPPRRKSHPSDWPHFTLTSKGSKSM